MRTIKFRGKRVDKDELVFGDLLTGMGYKKGKFYILPHLTYYPSDCNSLDGYEVETETVGQFTGLYDKDGKEIYEGDLIEVNGRLFGVVEWHKDGYFFINDTIVGIRSDGGSYSPIGEMVRYFSNHGHDFSVIGNIHDNPELLKRL